MSSVVISGDTSGAITLAAPATAGTNTLTLPSLTQTVNVMGPAFSAYQSVANSAFTTATKILFQTEDFDTANCFASSTFTPNVAGYYLITGAVGANGATTQWYTLIYKNGSQYRSGSFAGALTSTVTNPTSTFSTIVYLNGSTDYIEIYCSSGNSIPTSAGVGTFITGCFLRGA